MGDLLLNWLNDEIQLSKRISNFQEDFHNGFLFGELLAKYSQQLNFHQFIDKDDKASRVKNFSLLLDTFTALKVTFDSNVAMKIINRQLGVGKKLLYELKTALENTNAKAFSKSNRMNKTLEPLKKLQISKQKFDSVNKQHFTKQLNELHPAQKQIIQDRLLKKFGDFHSTTLLNVARADEKDMQANLLVRKKFNEQQRDNLKKSEEFRRQWEAQHMDKWAVNMTVRHTQVAKDQHFHSKVHFEKSQSKTMSEMSALKLLQNDIADFQKRNLKNKHDSDDEEEVSPETTQQLKEATKVLNKGEHGVVREQVREERRISAAEAEKMRHQRQKRRRKMIVQQQKRYQMIEINRRERIIISTIEQTSRQQKQIQYQIWRAWQNKNIITDNKNLHIEKIKEKSQVRDINAKFKRDQLLKVKREEHKEEVKKALYANTLLERNNQVKNRKGGYGVCEDMVKQLLQITEQMYISCQERNSQQLNAAELQAALIKFVEGTKTPEQEASLRLKHYVQGTHEWGFPIVRVDEQAPQDAKEENSLPCDTVNNHYLGNILRTVFENMYAQKESASADCSSDRLLISLVGLDFARKHFLAESIKTKHNLNIIYVDQLIEQRLKDFTDLKQKGVEVSKETEQLALYCFSGKPVPEQMLITLIKQSVEKNPHSLLVDYPNTYQQAISLCKAIGNVEPHDMLSTERLSRKIREYERLVKGTASRVVERRVKECGISFVWWIEVTTQNSFDRMLGRRWIGETQVHISEEVEPQALREGEKAAALVMNNQFKSKQKPKIKQWFELFGTQFGTEDPVSIKCWQEIDGNCDKQQLQWCITSKVEQMIAIKDKQKKWNQQLEESKKKKEEDMEKQAQSKEEIRGKCVKSTPQTIKQELQSALSKVCLSKQFLQQVSELWNKIEASTISSLSKAFLSLQGQQQSQRKYIAQVKRNFISLLTRQDHKFHLIKDFQSSYNEFLSENQDMLSYDYTKQELHQRVEDLENCLLDVVEEKKEDALSERSGIMSSGWLEAQFQIINQNAFVLVQTQINKFALSQKLITDFYGKKFMANTRNFQPLSPELNLETINALDIYKDGVAGRLQKMVSEALRILNREEEVSDDKNKKGGKGAPPKKDDKKGAKKGGKEEVEENKEPTAEEVELKKAINTEKAILRQRLNRIKTLCANRFKYISDCAQQLYNQLQDLYVYTEKVEKKAILGLAKIFRKSIENQQKIESEVQIRHVEVTQTDKIRNFQKQKPVIQPARELISDPHFTLSNLQEVIKLVREESEGHRISTKKLIVLLKKLTTHLQLRKLLPETWRAISSKQIESFVGLLDHQNRGYIDLVKILMFFVMSGYSIPTADQIEQYSLDLTNYSSLKEADLAHLTSTKAWFDQSPAEQQNIRPFVRDSHVKEVLFSLFKSGASQGVEIGGFINSLILQQYSKMKECGSSYFDFAFKQ